MNPLKVINSIDLFFMEARAMTRQQLADMYGCSTKTLNRLLDDAGINLPPGTITPKYVELIFLKLGTPPNYHKYKAIIKL